MGVTAIRWVENRSGAAVALLDIENPNVPGHAVSIAPGAGLAVNMWVPWAAQAPDFGGHHLELQVNGQSRYWIWQAANADGDFVRFSRDGSWHDRGSRAHGMAAVNGDRTMVVRDGCFELLELPSDLGSIVTGLFPAGTFRLAGPPLERMVGSIPKSSASAFSMAGIPSDAYMRGMPGARFLYGDSGKRYRFEIRKGVVTAVHPDGSETVLSDAVSYLLKRRGDPASGNSVISTAPPFDLIASNGGRVFAKARGMDRFYFATMDHMFIHVRDDGSEFPVPSTYFKLDPEFNQPGARVDDLTAPLQGCFFDHPAAERFPLFRWLLEQNVADLMVVSVLPRTWHLVDVRPPQGAFNLELLPTEFLRRAVLTLTGLSPWLSAFDAVEAGMGNRDQQSTAPPAGVPSYAQATYSNGTASFQGLGIDYSRVLDIGVGHVHWHEQYEGVTGGELQPLHTGPIVPAPLPPIDYAYLYRIFNGPVRDGDGYIDGTCNYYALVQLHSGACALLYIDEQSYFTKRWRLVDPVDVGGLDMALAKDLAKNPRLYNWNPATFWSPFQAGLVGSQSRLAVSRQVLLVTGVDPDGTTPVIYSINFSYATMDRTWRWRQLPARAQFYDPEASGGADPAIPGDVQDCVYPQTIRLREDMTVHMMGASHGTAGRWYQRYLPATNELVPSGDQLTSGRPGQGYAHPWKFLPEQVFRAADAFSHVGVYETVNSRMQYFVVQPAGDADSGALESGGSGPWTDDGAQLFINAWKFWWAGPLHLLDLGVSVPGGIGPPPKRPPSLFNPDTRFTIVKRGSFGWIAMYWDKRDDDLMPLDGLPATLVLRNGDRQVTVTLQSNHWVDGPPVVQSVQCAAPGNLGFPGVLTFQGAFQNVWRIRMAALDPARPGGVVQLLDAETEGYVSAIGGGVSEYRWTPPAAQVPDLQHYCSPDNVLAYGTSIWFEDIVGHVSVPEQIDWLRPLNVAVSPHPIQLEAPVSLTVQAQDALSPSTPVPATVTIHNFVPGSGWQDVPFPIGQAQTITLQGEYIPGTPRAPHGEPGDPAESIDPGGRVSAPGYGTVDIPFVFDRPPRPRPDLAAHFVTQSVPASMTAGRSAAVSVTMDNTGRAIWTSRGSTPYRLGSQNPQDNGLWGVSRVDVPADVAPGTRVTFGFTMTAPRSPGTYNFQWRMVEETVSWFGEVTPNVSIVVAPPQLDVRVDPQPTAINQPVQIVVHAEDAGTHTPVAGTVTIDNWVAGRPVSQQFPTNTAFTVTLHSHLVRGPRGTPPEVVVPTGTVTAPGYPPVAITFDSLD